MATIPPHPHYIGPRDEDYDVAAAIADPDSMWIVRPLLFFSCTLRPLDATVDRYKKSADDIPIDLFFSVPLRTFAYASQAPWSPTESESFTSPPPFPPSMLARLRIFLVKYHYFHASLMAAPPPPFQTSTLRDRVGTSNSAVLTDLARDRAEAAMYVRSTLGFGTLAGPSLVLPVSLLLKRRRSARGAGVTLQRAPGRPCGPGNVQQRLMLTYDIHKPVIYLSYATGQ